MLAAQEILDLSGEGRERRLGFEYVPKFLSTFTLSQGDAVAIPLPARPNVVSMAEETLIAVYELGHGLSHVVSSPRCGIEVVPWPNCWLLLTRLDLAHGWRANYEFAGISRAWRGRIREQQYPWRDHDHGRSFQESKHLIVPTQQELSFKNFL
jgi:hypothetical protein